MAKSITHCQGNGSLTHNNRTFTAKNIETGKTVFSGKVTVKQDDYDILAGLAKKQIATESKSLFSIF